MIASGWPGTEGRAGGGDGGASGPKLCLLVTMAPI
ncbi:hypothetical protein EV679_1375 [Kerstersia gyiorum]|uniref:Uncharacterized protein n=1 Tax=Kerstersia gyiorum TaxID=206506 RepID=A0A4Q7MN61_9BURK|nr:hypothetical protein EV679_1375 [Kerstersia gyiorum]